MLLGLLVLQLALPLIRPAGVLSQVAYWVWLTSFLVMAAVAFLNRSQPGMWIVCVALLLNGVVIAVNGGMPVSAEAVLAIGGTAASAIPRAGDFAHVALSSATRLWWLADVLPTPGPLGIAALVSPGDVLLMAGVSVFVAGAMTRRAGASRL